MKKRFPLVLETARRAGFPSGWFATGKLKTQRRGVAAFSRAAQRYDGDQTTKKVSRGVNNRTQRNVTCCAILAIS